MKKKKKLKIAIALVMYLIGELAHCWLSTSREVIKNYGISFGISGWFFIFLNVVFIIFLTNAWWKNDFLGINLMMAGGWINLIDRIFLGYVRDYWQIGLVYNNLADWIIQLGVIIILSQLWIKMLK